MYTILTILFLLIVLITLFMWWQGKISNNLVNTPPPITTHPESNHTCNAGCPVNKFPDGIVAGLA